MGIPQGFIPSAVNVPAKDLAAWKERFPKDTKAPIVLYDASDAGLEPFATVRGWGYPNTSVLSGGRAAWTGKVATGALAPAIAYQKRLAPGEIPADELRKIAQARPAGTLLVDVREPPVDGVLPGALSIPESQLAGRLKEIPRNREVVIHCNTGILARRAYDLLAGKGYRKVRWANAVVMVGANGAYEVTEK
ncbi:MAG TPA: rhodanese-like domain-containing protein [Anaeromyxobacter sp.]|nr:rhodanese-like domain-containing protein [Anaeromyxobacter sp.]